MIGRIVLSVVAVLVIAWTAILLRDDLVGHDASVRSFYATELPASARANDLRTLRDADFLDPSSTWLLAETSNRLRAGDLPGTARLSERLVRGEPDNVSAWRFLEAAMARSDPARAREAAAEVKRLNPFGTR